VMGERRPAGGKARTARSIARHWADAPGGATARAARLSDQRARRATRERHRPPAR
jgi:hypothetical protein